MRAIAVVKPNQVRIIDLPVPKPGPYQALVKTEVAYLCNATDGKLVAGHFPGVDQYPLVLGHESAGIVHERLLCLLISGEKTSNLVLRLQPGSSLSFFPSVPSGFLDPSGNLSERRS